LPDLFFARQSPATIWLHFRSKTLKGQDSCEKRPTRRRRRACRFTGRTGLLVNREGSASSQPIVKILWSSSGRLNDASGGAAGNPERRARPHAEEGWRRANLRSPRLPPPSVDEANRRGSEPFVSYGGLAAQRRSSGGDADLRSQQVGWKRARGDRPTRSSACTRGS